MRSRTSMRVALVVAAASLCACSGTRDPSTPQEAAARGDELMRKLADTLKSAQAFSFTVDESIERVRRNGEKLPVTLTREIVVRRPDRLRSHATGSDNRDVTVTYDGKTITVVGNREKVYAKVNAPATLDETLDLISERFDLRVSVADFLYSSPYDVFKAADAQGGWTKRVTVDGQSCEEVSYKTKTVDLTLSVAATGPALPCRAEIVFKEEPKQPVTRLVFHKWDLQVKPADAQFVANVPEGYELIPIVERIPKAELKTDAAKAMGAEAAK